MYMKWEGIFTGQNYPIVMFNSSKKSPLKFTKLFEKIEILGLSFKYRIIVLKCLQRLRIVDYMTDFSCQMQQKSFVIDADTCIDGFKQAIFKVANFLVLMYCTASIPIFISI